MLWFILKTFYLGVKTPAARNYYQKYWTVPA